MRMATTSLWFADLLVENHADEQGERVAIQRLVGRVVDRQGERHTAILLRRPGQP